LSLSSARRILFLAQPGGLDMKFNATSKWGWLNPLCWFQQIYAFVAALVTDILKLFGRMPPPATDGFENIQANDVEDAAAGAVEKEASVDASLQQLTPPDIVHAYALATEEQRATMDLGKLSPLEQDWLLALDETDLILLGQSGVGACARSLRSRAVFPSVRRLRGEDNDLRHEECDQCPDDADRDAGKRTYISARFHELMSTPSGSDPHHQPISLSRH
jgi:hypothetical protein